ncbi:MAG: thioredoxin family protein [Verrucomicrobiales bacterium]|nr:thioredoxin family protein [Verrucomicrobiales bacterium]
MSASFGDGPATKASLLVDAAVARPGSTVWAAVRLEMKDGWHTYWRNPGESGMATGIEWTLPAGLSAGEIHWPPPEPYTGGGLTTYVYHREVLLLVPLAISDSTPVGPAELKAAVNWLECEEACVPGDATVTTSLTIGAETAVSESAALIAEWRGRLPQSNPALKLAARWEGEPSADKAQLVIEAGGVEGFAPTDFFAYAGTDYEISPAVATMVVAAGRTVLTKSALKYDGAWPTRLGGLLAQLDENGQVTRAVEVSLAPGGSGSAAVESQPEESAPPPDDSEVSSAATGTKPAAQSGAPRSLLGVLLLAFLGGLVLNVMPCVLPVIALKILGFVHQSKEAPGRVKRLGLTYGGGVLASFLAMAAVVVAVQAAGGGASWGMQMQNPYFRLALLVVVLLVALNLFGVFEITLGGSAMGAASKLASREGYPGAFFNGVLATALGTSCTAPFLAVAVGFAFTQSAAVVFLMFLTIGLGLAFPYVLLSLNPAWLRFLPKPGLWMQHFKVAMGFPMLGTAIWMFEFTAPSYGSGGVLWLGMFLAVIALVVWIWGEFVQRGTKRKGLAMGVCLLLMAAAYGVILENQLHWRHPAGATTQAGYVQDLPDGLKWYPWSPEAVDQARQSGKLALVDFTAKWCPNCRSNKKFAIDIPSVRDRLDALGGQVFRADYTDKDPRITEELRRYERAGVPLVLVFPADPAKSPLVLPTLLTPGIVLEALRQAAEG